ncbi:MAG: hypothetical protein H0T57_12030 [Rubrobacter sp.]|nr:hypothetical protein [Rubrobacter sp.]
MSEIDGRPENKVSRRRFIRGAAFGAFALATPGLFTDMASAQTTPDALHRRARVELKVFID